MKIFLSALSVSLGLAACGYFLGNGIKMHNKTDSTISVRGLSEIEVSASLAITKFSYSTEADSIDKLRAKLDDNYQALKKYLISKGFDESELAIQPASVSDYHRSHEYIQGMYNHQRLVSLAMKEAKTPGEAQAELPALELPDELKRPRYTASQKVVLRTNKVQKVKPCLGALTELLEQNVIIDNDEPEFIFERLNDIKPKMIAEATANALVAAKKFSEDTNTKLGSLDSASQGIFDIADRDEATSENKVVRVVVNVSFNINP